MSIEDGINITIPGQTPSKKNNKRIVKNRKTGATFIISSQKHAEWYDSSFLRLKQELRELPRGDFGKVTINYMFYVRDNRRRDVSNMLESINDLLVDLGILEDDDWKHLRIGWADAEVDKENPRCELTIKQYRG